MTYFGLDKRFPPHQILVISNPCGCDIWLFSYYKFGKVWPIELLNWQILVYYKRTSETHIIRQHTVSQMLVIHNADVLPSKEYIKILLETLGNKVLWLIKLFSLDVQSHLGFRYFEILKIHQQMECFSRGILIPRSPRLVQFQSSWFQRLFCEAMLGF